MLAGVFLSNKKTGISASITFIDIIPKIDVRVDSGVARIDTKLLKKLLAITFIKYVPIITPIKEVNSVKIKYSIPKRLITSFLFTPRDLKILISLTRLVNEERTKK